MKTEFKIFKGSYDSLEEQIKEYQEKYNVEIKNVVFLDSYTKIVIGVVFKRSSKFDKTQRDIGAAYENE